MKWKRERWETLLLPWQSDASLHRIWQGKRAVSFWTPHEEL